VLTATKEKNKIKQEFSDVDTKARFRIRPLATKCHKPLFKQGLLGEKNTKKRSLLVYANIIS